MKEYWYCIVDGERDSESYKTIDDAKDIAKQGRFGLVCHAMKGERWAWKYQGAILYNEGRIVWTAL